MVSHEQDRGEWGASARLRLDPGEDGRGMFLTLTPSRGTADAGIAQLFDGASGSALSRAPSPTAPQARLDAEFGYGFGIARDGPPGVLTPHVRLSSFAGERGFLLGANYLVGTDLSLAIELERRTSATEKPDHGLVLRGTMRW